MDQMAETTSQRQLRRREAGWEGSRRRNRDPRDTNRIGGVPARASQQAMTKPEPSRGCHVYAAGARGRLAPLSGEISMDVPGCPSTDQVIVGWQGTTGAERRRFTIEKSAEAVVAADRAPRRAERNAEDRAAVLA